MKEAHFQILNSLYFSVNEYLNSVLLTERKRAKVSFIKLLTWRKLTGEYSPKTLDRLSDKNTKKIL